ncbi:MAG TPA: hypothetical protein VIM89_06080 [Mucilaginibacter sp.]
MNFTLDGKLYGIKCAIVITIALFSNCNSKTDQSSYLPLFPYSDAQRFNWTSLEKQNAPLKERFIKLASHLLENEYPTYCTDQDITKLRRAEFEKTLHVLDFNGDGLDDIIYEGNSGGEPQEVAFLLNTGNDFKLVFRETQSVAAMRFTDHKLTNVYFVDSGCCEDYIDFCKVYNVKYDDGALKFVNTYTTASINSTYWPKKFLNHPIYFEVLNNNYKMRLAPVIDDNTINDRAIPQDSLIGNTIDTLNKGTKGRAVAVQTDKTGRVWWLVEIDRDYSSYGHYFYEQDANLFYKESEDTTHKAAKMGWISSRYVKKIKRSADQ